MSAAVLSSPPAERRGGLRLRGVNWLVWRQNRVAFLVLTVCFAAAIAYLLYERAQLDVTMARIKALHCRFDQPPGRICDELLSSLGVASDLRNVTLLLLIAPGLLGAAMAAQPLAADLEQGRHLLLWSQSVSPRRWFTHRLALPALVLLVLSTVLSTTVRWVEYWSHPPQQISYLSTSYGNHDLVPVYPALTLAAFALGALVGLLVHRVVPAFGVTLGLHAALLVGLQKVFPFLLPLHRRVLDPRNLSVDTGRVYETGVVVNGRYVHFSDCQATGCRGPLSELYHPASEFSPMLWIETGLLLLLTGVLLALAYRRLRALTR